MLIRCSWFKRFLLVETSTTILSTVTDAIEVVHLYLKGIESFIKTRERCLECLVIFLMVSLDGILNALEVLLEILNLLVL